MGTMGTKSGFSFVVRERSDRLDSVNIMEAILGYQKLKFDYDLELVVLEPRFPGTYKLLFTGTYFHTYFLSRQRLKFNSSIAAHLAFKCHSFARRMILSS